MAAPSPPLAPPPLPLAARSFRARAKFFHNHVGVSASEATIEADFLSDVARALQIPGSSVSVVDHVRPPGAEWEDGWITFDVEAPPSADSDMQAVLDGMAMTLAIAVCAPHT